MRSGNNLDTRAGARLDARAQAPLQQQPAHPGLVRVLRLVARQRPQPRMHLLLGRAPPPLPSLSRVARVSVCPWCKRLAAPNFIAQCKLYMGLSCSALYG